MIFSVWKICKCFNVVFPVATLHKLPLLPDIQPNTTTYVYLDAAETPLPHPTFMQQLKFCFILFLFFSRYACCKISSLGIGILASLVSWFAGGTNCFTRHCRCEFTEISGTGCFIIRWHLHGSLPRHWIANGKFCIYSHIRRKYFAGIPTIWLSSSFALSLCHGVMMTINI